MLGRWDPSILTFSSGYTSHTNTDRGAQSSTREPATREPGGDNSARLGSASWLGSAAQLGSAAWLGGSARLGLVLPAVKVGDKLPEPRALLCVGTVRADDEKMLECL